MPQRTPWYTTNYLVPREDPRKGYPQHHHQAILLFTAIALKHFLVTIPVPIGSLS